MPARFFQPANCPERSATALVTAASVVAVLHDPGELVRVQTGTTDEGTVDVGLGHQLGDVGGLDRSAVLNPNRGRGRSVVQVLDAAADRRADRLRVVGGRGAAGADRPDRLV